MAIKVENCTVHDLAALGEEWQALELRAAPSFFQSWTWIGCLAAERYPDPVLLRAFQGGRTLGLALFNRRHGRLCLAESGEQQLDAPFIEHNGPLLATGSEGLVADFLQAAWKVKAVRRLHLSGVPAAVVEAAGGVPRRLQSRPVPVLDLGPIRRAGDAWLAHRSANTRQQIRRSALAYVKMQGALHLCRAETPAKATAFLDALIELHQASWQKRGQDGAFLRDFSRRFHHALVLRALARQQLDLLQVSAGGADVGYLYNFRCGGRVLAYQSGFAPALVPQAKPGMTCHAMAIDAALQQGMETYDFLAGDQRYKRSLSDREETLWWAELVPRWSPWGLALRAVRAIRPAG
ncbi:GNAT family N-acetyltransferase [Falsiroseomonas sp.]|uniref:GNAT family N-acetyltransferase n=1 Tax=Falsiroseomonas sp. TaxID=2870721 RepID=UPI00271F7FB5|nr:GNAT family N-acetyltransferase [Falsiroseomonas sp.]MDO9498823.1 GNAT family N-acetyltransferase [Falsiroseomonas sp.]